MNTIDKNFLQNKIEKYKQLTTSIENLIASNELNQAAELVEEYGQEIQNSSLYSYKAILSFQLGNFKEAIQILDKGIEQHPFSFSLYYNLGFMYGANQEYEMAIKNYFYAMKYSQTEDEKESALSGVKEISEIAIKAGEKLVDMQEIVREYKKILQEYDARVYPIDAKGISMIRKPQLVGTPNEYMINMYSELSFADVDLQSRMLFKSELIKGSILTGKRKWKTTGPVVIPLSKIEHNATIKITVNGEKYKFGKDALPINQYHYIRISNPGVIEITSDVEIFVGDLIEIEPQKKPVKLALKIFVDGLSYQFLEDNNLREIMPNTYNFFEKGFISTNCYTTSEWTLPSKSSINTGVYSTKHLMLQPNHLFNFRNSEKLLAEYFQEQGYYCASISPNWRTTPALGYYKGFNRMIYKNFLGGMGSKEIIMETIEHLNTYDSNNNYISMSLLDLHNVPDQIENHLYSQVHVDINDRIYKKSMGKTSVQTKYDKSKIAKYHAEISRIDKMLCVLYDFILENFSNEEILIMLHSDHGQSFLENDFNLLSDNRLKIPFMMRGKDVPIEQCAELIESVDILPSILRYCDMKPIGDIDGKLPKVLGGKIERESTFSQIIHPQQTYKAKFHEKEFDYYFETKHVVLDDLTINVTDYSSKIVNSSTGEDFTNKNLQKKNYYDELVFNKIKNMLRWTD